MTGLRQLILIYVVKMEFCCNIIILKLILHLKMHPLQIIPYATKELHPKNVMEMGYFCA